MSKIALITGATSGIGRATALILGKNGYDIIACGRRQERLQKLQEELKGTCETHPLVFGGKPSY